MLPTGGSCGRCRGCGTSDDGEGLMDELAFTRQVVKEILS